ncbi:hypothetical protein ABEB36_015699 [Hypothenemus hampei]|uniref:Uncharacterized protein n=1 Tax=Hypothenemus hampei TaxID=57062 RepID=A0ABD1DZ77_HYPHA
MLSKRNESLSSKCDTPTRRLGEAPKEGDKKRERISCSPQTENVKRPKHNMDSKEKNKVQKVKSLINSLGRQTAALEEVVAKMGSPNKKLKELTRKLATIADLFANEGIDDTLKIALEERSKQKSEKHTYLEMKNEKIARLTKPDTVVVSYIHSKPEDPEKNKKEISQILKQEKLNKLAKSNTISESYIHTKTDEEDEKENIIKLIRNHNRYQDIEDILKKEWPMNIQGCPLSARRSIAAKPLDIWENVSFKTFRASSLLQDKIIFGLYRGF